MLTISTLAETAALVGDPARANMLTALMDGRALTAAELARAAGVAPQTASGHLAQLTEAGLLAMERQGRHRYHRLASPRVAEMLESIMAVAADLGDAGGGRRTRPAVVGPRDQALRRARTCYNHLAGQIAVAMADRMVERGQVDLSPDGGALTDDGAVFSARPRRRPRRGDGARQSARRRTRVLPPLPRLERAAPAYRRRGRRGAVPDLPLEGMAAPARRHPRRARHPRRPDRAGKGV